MAAVCLGLHLPSASRLWQKYNNALKHAPLATKSLTCMVAYSFGDLSAQIAFSKQRHITQKIADIDGLRVLRMALYGALWCGPVGHHFYAGLDKVFHAQPLALTIAGKVGLDQLLYAPISTAAFFAWINIASGTAANTRTDLAEKLAPSVKAAWALWVPAMTINMALVPPDMRILFINATAIVWTMVLSSMADSGVEAVPDAAPLPASDDFSLAAASIASAPAALEAHPLALDADCEADGGFGGGVVSAVWQKLMNGVASTPRRTSSDAKPPVRFLFEWPSLDSMQWEEVPHRMLRSISTFGSVRSMAALDDLDLCVAETPSGEDADGACAGTFEAYASQNLVDVLEECLP